MEEMSSSFLSDVLWLPSLSAAFYLVKLSPTTTCQSDKLLPVILCSHRLFSSNSVLFTVSLEQPTNSPVRTSLLPLDSLFISRGQNQQTQSKWPLDAIRQASNHTVNQSCLPSLPSWAGAMFVLRGISGEIFTGFSKIHVNSHAPLLSSGYQRLASDAVYTEQSCCLRTLQWVIALSPYLYEKLLWLAHLIFGQMEMAVNGRVSRPFSPSESPLCHEVTRGCWVQLYCPLTRIWFWCPFCRWTSMYQWTKPPLTMGQTPTLPGAAAAALVCCFQDLSWITELRQSSRSTSEGKPEDIFSIKYEPVLLKLLHR